MLSSLVSLFGLTLLHLLRGAAAQLGAGVPGPLHFPLPVRYFSGRYFVQGGCSEYLNRPTLQVDRLNAPLPPKGSSLQSAYSFFFRTAQSEAFGFNAPALDILYHDFKTGRVVLGNPGATAGQPPLDPLSTPAPINYTFLGPYTSPADLSNKNVTWYLSTLLSAQYYSMLLAFGPLVVQPNNFPGCIQGAAWELQGLVDYFAGVLKLLLPGVKVVDGMRLNQRVLAPGSKPVNMTTPLGLYETNTLYQMAGILPAPANASASFLACAAACVDSQQCTAWAYCNSTANCSYPATTQPLPVSQHVTLPPSASPGPLPAQTPVLAASTGVLATKYAYRTCLMTGSPAFSQSRNGQVVSSGITTPWISGRVTLPRPEHLQSSADPGPG